MTGKFYEDLEVGQILDHPKGIVRLKHAGCNQKGEIVLTFERSCLMKMRPACAS